VNGLASKYPESKFVVLEGVSKRYGSLLALESVSFEVEEGEVFGYIGPNGAGKTTTMKIMVGLLSDFQGTVHIGGFQMPARTEEVHRLLGYMPQNIAFQEWRTVDQALRTLGRLSGLGESEVDSRIAEVSGILGLSDVRKKKIGQLSGGTVQKVGLAQALLHKPQLLVLDEPLAGLDPASRYQLKQVITELGKDGVTVFFSSHILSDVEDVATRIGILSRGRIKQVGTLDELKSRLRAENAVEIILSRESEKRPMLESVKGVSSWERTSEGKIIVHLSHTADSDEAIHNVTQSLIKSGNHIRSVIPKTPTLDEVYLRYVEGDQGS
jgi:ABC-2 type transport system ATP-binding protein